MSIKNCVLVFDVGKTHIKVTVLDGVGGELNFIRRENRVREIGPYPNFDTDSIWDWLTAQIKTYAALYEIKAISLATHGATAALVDLDAEALILPVMDYEFDDYPSADPDYGDIRPSFSVTGSPHFPGGLNLGRQLFYQSSLMSERERANATLLFYPQYWSWRLTGVACAEVTSLGCHTDLWDMRTGAPSALLDTIGLGGSLPQMIDAWTPAGMIKPELASSLGLPDDCRVYPGVHDSNAGYVPWLAADKGRRPTVISTGTWSIAMTPDGDLDRLDPKRDMLVNIDATGTPLVTSRYMGGREFGLICERLNTDIATTFTNEDVEHILRTGLHILPSLCPGTGPYGESSAKIVQGETRSRVNGKAAATLYSALMLDDILRRQSPGSGRDIVMEGSFAANEVLCRLLAALNPERKLYLQNGQSGVTEGCFCLTQWGEFNAPILGESVVPFVSDRLKDYAQDWRDLLQDNAMVN